MERTELMTSLAVSLTKTINTFGCRHDITISYGYFDTMDDIASIFTEWQIKYLGILPGIEYFLVCEPDPETGLHVLYAVNVSADSCLTAAAELLDLASRKGL